MGLSQIPGWGDPIQPRLTVQLLPKEREKDGEVDGTLSLLQHGIQLLFWDAHLPWLGVGHAMDMGPGGPRPASPPSGP